MYNAFMKNKSDAEKLISWYHLSIGKDNKTLGRGWHVHMSEKTLKVFFNELDKEKRKSLYLALFNFYVVMENLRKMLRQSKDEEAKYSIANNFAADIWSQFALGVITSIVEFVTQKDSTLLNLQPTKSFLNHLKENIAFIKSGKDLDYLSKSYRKIYPPVGVASKLAVLYEKFLTSEEKKKLIKQYKALEQKEGKLKINSLKDIAQDMYWNTRSAFSHSLGFFSSIPAESTLFTFTEERPNVIGLLSNASMPWILFLTWKAIFKYYGYQGTITTGKLSGKTDWTKDDYDNPWIYDKK